jgi:hypothetical protein
MTNETILDPNRNYGGSQNGDNGAIRAQDFSEVLKVQDYKIKNLLYKCQHLSGQSMVEELRNEDCRMVELMKDIPFYAKIRVGDRKPPMTLTIRYLQGKGSSDLYFYGSYKDTKPSADKNDLCKSGAPQRIIVAAKDGSPESEHFGVQYFYMCFNTNGPIKFTVTPTFPSSFKDDTELLLRRARAAEVERLNRLSLLKMVRENKDYMYMKRQNGLKIEKANIVALEGFRERNEEKYMVRSYE